MKIKQLVIFAILMENNEGIMGKAPSYVLEKFEACQEGVEPEWILDTSNLEKYNQYMKRWVK